MRFLCEIKYKQDMTMQISLVLTILGDDRQGLVNKLSHILQYHQANWSESRMVHLAGKFAGVLLVALPEEQLSALHDSLATLRAEGLQVVVEQTELLDSGAEQTLKIELLGQDRPGIIHDISQKLATLNVNIEELESEQRIASMSSEVLFYAQLTLGLPENVSPEAVQDSLEELSDQLMVDLNFGVD
jgi:glycine cleavage system regulatory protein